MGSRGALAAPGALAVALAMTSCATAAEPVASGSPLASEAPDAPEASAYRDGEYSATGWYGSLPSHHDVTLTIEGDIVTAVEITTPAADETSLGYQQRFAEALPSEIIGRQIDEIDVDRLAGSSGCSEGFMDALAKIQAEASA